MFTRNAARYGMAGVMLCISLLLGLAQERRVESVAVRGLRNISETAVIAALRLKPGEPFTEATLESDRRAILAMGLFSDVRPRVEQTETGVRVVFEVVENPLIREVRFTGNTVFSAEQLLEVVRNKPGFVFNTNFAEPDIRAIRDAYQRAGYIVLPEGYTPPDYENGILTIALSELRVGEIRIEGNTKTRTNVILREMRIKPGDLFNTQRFQRDINRLYNLNYFDQITPEDSLAAPGCHRPDAEGQRASDGQAECRVCHRLAPSADRAGGGLRDQLSRHGAHRRTQLPKHRRAQRQQHRGAVHRAVPGSASNRAVGLAV
jgi:hypothetical protein